MKRKFSLLHRLVLAFLMALPLIVGIAFLTGFTYGMCVEYKRYVQSRTEAGWQLQSGLVVLRDGTPVIEKYIRRENSYERTFTKMDGRKIPRDTQTLYGITLQPDSDEKMRQLQLQYRLLAPIGGTGLPTSWQLIWWQFDDAEDRRYVWLFHESELSPGVYYLIKTDRKQQQVISGYFDRNGPREDEPGLETSFRKPLGVIESNGVIVFQSGSELVAVDLNNNSVAQIGDQTTLRWGIRKGNSDAEHRPEIILVTDDAIRTVDYSGKERHAYAVDGTVSELYITDDERLLVMTVGDYESETTTASRVEKRLERLYELGDDGQSRELAQFFGRFANSAPEAENTGIRGVDSFIRQAGLGVMFPGPAVLLGIETGYASISSLYKNTDGGFADGWREIQKLSPWGLPMSAVLGLIAAYFCYRRQRRYQARWTKSWTLFVFLFGPAGYLAWRCHREWPPLELVGVTGDEFEGPVANGLEVFA